MFHTVVVEVKYSFVSNIVPFRR